MSLIDGPSLIIRLGGAACSLLAFGRGGGGVAGLARLALPMGLAATFIGLIHMLTDLDDPSALGPALGVSLLTAFYGAVLRGAASTLLPTMGARDEQSPGKHRTLAAGIFLVLTLVACGSNGNLASFLHIPSVVAVAVSVAVILVAAKRSPDADGLSSLGRRLPGVGLLLLFAGTIASLMSLPDPAAIGPAMALGLVGYFYAITLSVVCALLSPAAHREPLDGGDWLHAITSLLGCSALLAILAAALMPV